MKKEYNYSLIETLKAGIIIPDIWYTIEQAAYYLGVHKQTVYKYLRRPNSSLVYSISDNGFHKLIQGEVLIRFKLTNKKKSGRKPKS